jgi:transcriptional regulator with XRE-family HTH domain
MARAALSLGVRELAQAAVVSTSTITRIEAGEELKPRTVAAVRQALEDCGVIFIDENGGGAGVRLFKDPLVGWSQCATPFPGDFAGIRDVFEKLFMARGGPPEMALFSRTDRTGNHEIFLLSPAATILRTSLRGDWVPAQNPSLFGWALLVGHHDAHHRLGVPAPRPGRSA